MIVKDISHAVFVEPFRIMFLELPHIRNIPDMIPGAWLIDILVRHIENPVRFDPAFSEK